MKVRWRLVYTRTTASVRTRCRRSAFMSVTLRLHHVHQWRLYRQRGTCGEYEEWVRVCVRVCSSS